MAATGGLDVVKVSSSLTVLSRNPQAGNYVHRNSVIVIVVSCGSVDLTVSDGSLWDRERRTAALDRNYTLRTEAEDVVRYTVFAIRHSMCVLTILGRYSAKIRPDSGS